IIQDRLQTSVLEWDRLGRRREALWSGRQLREVGLISAESLGDKERHFLAASTRAVRMRRWSWAAVATGVLCAVVGTGTTLRLRARNELRGRVAAFEKTARGLLEDAMVDR